MQFFYFVGTIPGFDGTYIFFQRRYIPFSCRCVERVCRRSAAQVRNAFPVRSVVARVDAGFAEVRYLVMLVTGSVEGVYQGGKEAYATFFIHFMNVVGLQQIIDASTFLVNNMISRDVLNIEADCFIEIALPTLVRFLRQAVDEVKNRSRVLF